MYVFHPSHRLLLSSCCVISQSFGGKRAIVEVSYHKEKLSKEFSTTQGITPRKMVTLRTKKVPNYHNTLKKFFEDTFPENLRIGDAGEKGKKNDIIVVFQRKSGNLHMNQHQNNYLQFGSWGSTPYDPPLTVQCNIYLFL